MLIGYFVVGLCVLGQYRVQATVLVTIEDVTIDMLDPEYVKDAEATINNDDDNTLNIGFNIIKEIPETGEGHFTLYALSMGEYSRPTGVDVDMTMCELIDEPIIMGPIFTALGFSGECPVPPGRYETKRYKLPVDNFPDEFDENQYETRFELIVNGKTIMAIRTHLSVESLPDL